MRPPVLIPLLAIAAGAAVGGALGWHSRAEALSCGCMGEQLQLELVSGPDVACADGSCDSEWAQSPGLRKSDDGLYGDLVRSGQLELQERDAGGE